jgi:hypothetical protein
VTRGSSRRASAVRAEWASGRWRRVGDLKFSGALAQDLDGLARIDAGEHHDVGGDHLDGGGRGDRRWYCPGLLAPATDQMTAMLSQVRT